MRYATTKSQGGGRPRAHRAGTNPGLVLAVMALALGCGRVRAVDGEGSAQALSAFREAQARFKRQPAAIEPAWQFGRACFDLAEFATNSTERAGIADQGVAACRQALQQDTNSAPAQYYLGMNLAQLARTKGFGALKIVDQMEREFERARKLDETFDYAGADRNLGLLYRDTPAVISIGSRTKAREHLQKAVELAPQYPENMLNLVEALLKWGDRSEARRQLKALDDAWAAAKARFAGPAWEATWADWEARRLQARKKTAEPAHIPSPKQ